MRYLFLVAKVVVAGGLIAWLVMYDRLDLGTAFGAISPVSVVGLVLVGANVAIVAGRWLLLLRIEGEPFAYSTVFRWTLVGEFFALVAPTMSGDIVRGVYLFRPEGRDRLFLLSTIPFDRALGLLALLTFSSVLFLGSSAWGTPLPEAAVPMGFIALGATATAVAGLVSAPWLVSVLGLLRPLLSMAVADRLGEIVGRYRRHVGRVGAALLVSLLSQLPNYAAFVLAAYSLGLAIDPKAVVLALPFIFLAMALPIAPGGIGVGEVAASLLLAKFGIPDGAAIMLIYRTWLLVMQLIGGVAFLAWPAERRKPLTPGPTMT
jgi:glycosyltransferase 2 family protein